MAGSARAMVVTRKTLRGWLEERIAALELQQAVALDAALYDPSSPRVPEREERYRLISAEVEAARERLAAVPTSYRQLTFWELTTKH